MCLYVFGIVFLSIKQSMKTTTKKSILTIFMRKCILEPFYVLSFLRLSKGDIATCNVGNDTVIGRNYINDIVGYLLIMIFKKSPEVIT